MGAAETYKAASEANDIEGLIALLTPDARLVSPLSARMVFRGRDDLRILLGVIYSTIKGLRWHEVLHDGDRVVLVGEGRVLGAALGDAMVLELDGDGRIAVIRPHLRPFVGLTLLALLMGPRLARHPGVLVRALKG